MRAATPADAAAIAAIEARSTASPWTAEMLAETLAQPTTRAFVAVDGGAVIGHVIASAVEGTGEIVLVAVDPDFRRRGLGEALMGAAEAAWDAGAVTEAFLEVRADNAAAIGLYERRGWRPIGLRRRYYRDGTDARIFRWARC